MNFETAKIIHNLLFTFMGLFHEKYLLRLRQESQELNCRPCFKKNHMKILNTLYQNDRITLTEIGKMLDIEKGSLTTLIDQLEKEDFVLRLNDPLDRRKSLICLSQHGREEMGRITNFCAAKVDELLLNFNSEEVQQFITSLQNVVGFMKKLND